MLDNRSELALYDIVAITFQKLIEKFYDHPKATALELKKFISNTDYFTSGTPEQNASRKYQALLQAISYGNLALLMLLDQHIDLNLNELEPHGNLLLICSRLENKPARKLILDWFQKQNLKTNQFNYQKYSLVKENVLAAAGVFECDADGADLLEFEKDSRELCSFYYFALSGTDYNDTATKTIINIYPSLAGSVAREFIVFLLANNKLDLFHRLVNAHLDLIKQNAMQIINKKTHLNNAVFYPAIMLANLKEWQFITEIEKRLPENEIIDLTQSDNGTSFLASLIGNQQWTLLSNLLDRYQHNKLPLNLTHENLEQFSIILEQAKQPDLLRKFNEVTGRRAANEEKQFLNLIRTNAKVKVITKYIKTTAYFSQPNAECNIQRTNSALEVAAESGRLDIIKEINLAALKPTKLPHFLNAVIDCQDLNKRKAILEWLLKKDKPEDSYNHEKLFIPAAAVQAALGILPESKAEQQASQTLQLLAKSGIDLNGSLKHFFFESYKHSFAKLLTLLNGKWDILKALFNLYEKENLKLETLNNVDFLAIIKQCIYANHWDLATLLCKQHSTIHFAITDDNRETYKDFFEYILREKRFDFFYDLLKRDPSIALYHNAKFKNPILHNATFLDYFAYCKQQKIIEEMVNVLSPNAKILLTSELVIIDTNKKSTLLEIMLTPPEQLGLLLKIIEKFPTAQSSLVNANKKYTDLITRFLAQEKNKEKREKKKAKQADVLQSQENKVEHGPSLVTSRLSEATSTTASSSLTILNAEEKKEWQKAILIAFCYAKEEEDVPWQDDLPGFVIEWNDGKDVTEYRMRAYKSKQEDIKLVHLPNDFIQREIGGRLKDFLTADQLAKVEVTSKAIKIQPLPHAKKLPLDGFIKINESITHKLPEFNTQGAVKDSVKETLKVEKPALKPDTASTSEATRQQNATQLDEQFTTQIKQLLSEIAYGDKNKQPFAFLVKASSEQVSETQDPLTFFNPPAQNKRKHYKKNKAKQTEKKVKVPNHITLTYSLADNPWLAYQQGWVERKNLLLTLAAVLDTIAPKMMRVDVNEAKQQVTIIITKHFPITDVQTQASNLQQMFAKQIAPYCQEKIARINAQAQPIVKDEQEKKNADNNNNNSLSKLELARAHIETLHTLPKPEKETGAATIYYFNYLFHLTRLTELSSGAVGSKEFNELRNKIRHFFEQVSWQTWNKKLAPLIIKLDLQLKHYTTHNLLQNPAGLFGKPKLTANLLQDVKESAQLVAVSVIAQTETEKHDNIFSLLEVLQDLEEINAQIQLPAGLNRENIVIAKMMIWSLIGNLVGNAEEQKAQGLTAPACREIYRLVGHHGFDKPIANFIQQTHDAHKDAIAGELKQISANIIAANASDQKPAYTLK